MNDFISLSLDLHVSFIYIAMFLSLLNIFIIQSQNPKKKYLAILPFYYTILACMIFTGMILMVFMNKNILTFAMIICAIFILVGAIKSYKKIKMQQNLDISLIKFIRNKYILDFCIYVVFFIVGKI